MSTAVSEDILVDFDEVLGRVRALAVSSADHPATKNDFYELWMAQQLSADQVEIVARNYYERVKRTPYRIALAYLHTYDDIARAEMVENLYDETGHGDGRKAHSVMLRGFLESLVSKMRGSEVTLADFKAPLLDSTRRLIEVSEQTFSSPHPAEVCGALLAQEWHAYPQLVMMYEGVRNYRHLFGFEEFHEQCEYFYGHIGATEKQHKVHSLSTAARTCRTVADIAHLEDGFATYLGLLADNWAEIHASVLAA